MEKNDAHGAADCPESAGTRGRLVTGVPHDRAPAGDHPRAIPGGPAAHRAAYQRIDTFIHSGGPDPLRTLIHSVNPMMMTVTE